jgi:hypothetical protein
MYLVVPVVDECCSTYISRVIAAISYLTPVAIARSQRSTNQDLITN